MSNIYFSIRCHQSEPGSIASATCLTRLDEEHFFFFLDVHDAAGRPPAAHMHMTCYAVTEWRKCALKCRRHVDAAATSQATAKSTWCFCRTRWLHGPRVYAPPSTHIYRRIFDVCHFPKHHTHTQTQNNNIKYIHLCTLHTQHSAAFIYWYVDISVECHRRMSWFNFSPCEVVRTYNCCIWQPKKKIVHESIYVHTTPTISVKLGTSPRNIRVQHVYSIYVQYQWNPSCLQRFTVGIYINAYIGIETVFLLARGCDVAVALLRVLFETLTAQDFSIILLFVVVVAASSWSMSTNGYFAENILRLTVGGQVEGWRFLAASVRPPQCASAYIRDYAINNMYLSNRMSCHAMTLFASLHIPLCTHDHAACNESTT